MPFTPFHMGPGLLIKSLLQGFFSLIIFGWAQFLMDLQPLFAMTTGIGKLHGFSHTYVGATLIAVFSALSGKWIYGLVRTFVEKTFSDYQQRLFAVPNNLTSGVCLVSAFIGTYSHVLLDSIMHADVEPYYPFSPENGLYLLLGIGGLYKLCLYSALVGAVIHFAVRWLKPGKSL